MVRGRDKRPNQARFKAPKSNEEALERVKLQPNILFVLHKFVPPKPVEELPIFEPLSMSPVLAPMNGPEPEPPKPKIGREAQANKPWKYQKDTNRIKALLRTR